MTTAPIPTAVQEILTNIALLENDLVEYESLPADEVVLEVEGEFKSTAAELRWITTGLIDGYREATKILHPETVSLFHPLADVPPTNELQ